MGASRSVETQDSGLPPASEWAHGVLEEVLAGLAAAGGTPAWLTLANTLPTPDVAWVEAFSGTLLELAAQAGLELVGGDTTAGPASVTVHVQGWVPRRDGASRERRPRATEGSAPAPLIARAHAAFPTAAAAVFLFDAAGRPAYDGLFFPRG